jgi:hypothetical protein
VIAAVARLEDLGKVAQLMDWLRVPLRASSRPMAAAE